MKELSKKIIDKLERFYSLAYPTLALGGRVSIKVKENLQFITDVAKENTAKENVETFNIFSGMFVKITRHYAGIGYRTEIGLIFQSYPRLYTNEHFIDYIIVEIEDDKYVGRVENYLLTDDDSWTISPVRANLGEIK